MSRSWSAASASSPSLVSRPSASGWPGLACAQAFGKHCADPVLRRSYAVMTAGRGVDLLDEDVAEKLSSDLSDSPADDLDEDSLVRRRRVEAVLLLAKNPLSPRKLAQLAQVADATEARTHVRDLSSVYQDLGRAMRIELIAGGYRMMTRPALAPWLSRLSHVPAPVRLSTPMMETLAIVAYRGPLARSGVEAVRGVACGELLRQLMERDLIRIAGRSEELGRPYLYGTTKRFLQLFGLANTEALPPIQWQTLQEDNPEESSQENLSVDSIPDETSLNQPDEPSPDHGSDSTVLNYPVPKSPVPKSSKEPVVSTSVASEPSSEANPMIDPIIAASQAATSIQDWSAEEVTAENPAAVIEDEEDDLYEGVNDDDDDDDWDDDDDDWDDDDEEDEDDDDDEEEDDDLDGDWEEVDDADDDDDSDVDDEDEDDDLDDIDQAEDDEDWSEDDDADEDEDDDEEWD